MTEHSVKVLIIDEDAAFLEEAVTELSDNFITTYASKTGVEGLKIFIQMRPSVVIVDAGIADIPFPSLLSDLKRIDPKALRIVTSIDYRVIEEIVQGIDTGLVYKYFRKPLNYLDLVEVINARTVGGKQAAAVAPAYAKLHSIVDKAKDVEKLRKQLESQMSKIKDIEAESLDKVKDVLEETVMLRKKVAGNEAVISTLQAKSLEFEELKKRNIDRVEAQREELRKELKSLRDDYAQLTREKDELGNVKSENEKLQKQIEAQHAENDDLRVSVAGERAVMIEEITREKEKLARMKDDAERIVEVQKERNKAELEALQNAFNEKKRQAEQDIEKLKTKLEENRKISLAEIESSRTQVEEELTRKKDEAEQSIQVQRERNKAEVQALRVSFEEEKKHAAWFEIEGLKAELEKDRQEKLGQIEQERKRAEADMEAFRRKQEEGKAALVKGLEEEKQRTTQEISKLKAEFAERNKEELAKLEEDRRRAEQEIAEIKANMIEEKQQLEKQVNEQRQKAESDLQHVRESAAKERERLTMELEAKLAERKREATAEVEDLRANATRELDRFKVEARKTERTLNDELNQVRRLSREMEDQLNLARNALESEIEKNLNGKDMAARELESLRADFAVAIQSREALVAEVDQLRERRKHQRE